MEKRLVDTHAVYSQHPSADAGQDLLDQRCRGAVVTAIAVAFGCRYRFGHRRPMLTAVGQVHRCQRLRLDDGHRHQHPL